MTADIRIEDDFELAVAEGLAFKTLYVNVINGPADEATEISADELRDRAVQGSIDAQVGWARRLLHGAGVARDLEAAFRWFATAARSGDAEALNMVGRCHELGWGVPIDPAQAAEWFTRAAAKGHAWSEFNLACLYAEGRGVPFDEGKALTLLVRSARRGNPKAMSMLGRFREASDADRRRQRSAALWYRWAAERGCFRGQFHHARYLVAEGRSGEATRWFRASLAEAPADFRREALAMLGTHADPEVRALASRFDAGDEGACS